MKEFNYLVEKARMIKTISSSGQTTCDDVDCDKCPLSLVNNGREISCHFFEALFPIEATAIVKVWAKEHPRKTLINVLLKAFPNAKLYSSGVPMTCARKLGLVDDCIVISENRVCEECWNQEVEEDQ